MPDTDTNKSKTSGPHWEQLKDLRCFKSLNLALVSKLLWSFAFSKLRRLSAPSPMRQWDELLCEILKVPVFVEPVFFILTRNLDHQKRVCCLHWRSESIFKQTAKMDNHASWITQRPGYKRLMCSIFDGESGRFGRIDAFHEMGVPSWGESPVNRLDYQPLFGPGRRRKSSLPS